MLTNFSIADREDRVVHRGAAVLDLAQDARGLHVVATINFKAATKMQVSKVEVEFGNRTWVQDILTIPLSQGDALDLNIAMHLIDTE